jgi:hypothetical protein
LSLVCPEKVSLSAGTAELVQFPGVEVGKPAWLRVSVKWRSSFSFEQDDAGQRGAAEFPISAAPLFSEYLPNWQEKRLAPLT